MTPQSLGQWCRRPGAPVLLRKGKPFCIWPDFPRWRESERERQLRAENKPSSTAEAERRFETARATKMEMEVAQLDGSLVAVDEVAKTVGGVLSQLRAQLVTFPQRWAPALVGLPTIPKTQAVLDEAIEELMATLSGT